MGNFVAFFYIFLLLNLEIWGLFTLMEMLYVLI